MSYADQVFIAVCRDILDTGFRDDALEVRPHWEDGTPAHTIKKFGVVNRYDLQKEFPIMTLRRTYFKSCVDELLWIWQKKSNDIHDLHSHVWDAWADEKGTIGKAYGYQLGVKHQYADGWYDQVDRVLKDLKENPASRRMLTNLFNHHDLSEMGLLPLRLLHDLQRHREYAQRYFEPAQSGHAHRQQLERVPVRRPGPHDGPGQRPSGRGAGPRHRRLPHL